MRLIWSVLAAKDILQEIFCFCIIFGASLLLRSLCADYKGIHPIVFFYAEFTTCSYVCFVFMCFGFGPTFTSMLSLVNRTNVFSCFCVSLVACQLV